MQPRQETTMRNIIQNSELQLENAHPISLGQARSQRVICLSGTLWLTVQGASADIFLKPGESYRLAHQGLVIVEGIGVSRMLLQTQRPAYLAWLSLRGRQSSNRKDQAVAAAGFPA
jgi:hypothetical protein